MMNCAEVLLYILYVIFPVVFRIKPLEKRFMDMVVKNMEMGNQSSKLSPMFVELNIQSMKVKSFWGESVDINPEGVIQSSCDDVLELVIIVDWHESKGKW